MTVLSLDYEIIHSSAVSSSCTFVVFGWILLWKTVITKHSLQSKNLYPSGFFLLMTLEIIGTNAFPSESECVSACVRVCNRFDTQIFK